MTCGPFGARRLPKSTSMTVMSHSQLAAMRWRAAFGLSGLSVPFPCSFPSWLASPLHRIVPAGSSLDAQNWRSAFCVDVTVVTSHKGVTFCDERSQGRDFFKRSFGCF